MVEFSEFYRRIPFFTRYWLSITVGLSILARVNVVDTSKLPLWWGPFFDQFEYWRPVTALFYVPPEHFYFLISNYFLYRYSEKLESQEFAGRPEDYLMVLVFNWVCCVVCAYYFKFPHYFLYRYSEKLESREFAGRPEEYLMVLVFNLICCVACAFYFNIPLLMSSMVMSVVTIWCQYNKNAVITTQYWYDTQFKAAYLPWAILVANIMYDHHHYFGRYGGRYGSTLSPQGTEEFAGIISGYLTYYLLVQYPRDNGVPSPLKAPALVKEWLSNARAYFNSTGRPGPRPDTRFSYSSRDQHPWGRGFTTGARASARCANEARSEDYATAQ